MHTPGNLSELRRALGFSKREVAFALRLSTDVWNTLEEGTIQLETLSLTCLSELAQRLQVSGETFKQLLVNSRPAPHGVCQRNRSGTPPVPQSFATVLTRSSMSLEDKQYWRGLLNTKTQTALQPCTYVPRVGQRETP